MQIEYDKYRELLEGNLEIERLKRSGRVIARAMAIAILENEEPVHFDALPLVTEMAVEKAMILRSFGTAAEYEADYEQRVQAVMASDAIRTTIPDRLSPHAQDVLQQHMACTVTLTYDDKVEVAHELHRRLREQDWKFSDLARVRGEVRVSKLPEMERVLEVLRGHHDRALAELKAEHDHSTESSP